MLPDSGMGGKDIDDDGAGSGGTRGWRGSYKMVEVDVNRRPQRCAATCRRKRQVR